jgi:glycosyltransferase involved in cell wall biosynthesis
MAARLYRRLVPAALKVRLAPHILAWRRRREAARRAGRLPEGSWHEIRTALGGGEGLRPLRYFPGGVQNPYLRLLYSRLPEEGFDPRPLGRYEMLDSAGDADVFHLHWTRVFQVGTGSVSEARSQTEAYLARIERFLSRGGRLVWSVHEALPHDCEFPEVEVALRRRLVELAAAVHVLHDSTAAQVADLYPLDPARTFTVEHPLYTGVYPDYVTRAAARRQLGVGPGEVLLLGFGAIRPYKGFDRLVELAPRVAGETGLPVRVMLAGPTFRSIDTAPLRDLVRSTPGASMSEGPVPDEYVQVLFRAADVVVLPYRTVLNSGVLMLALTFGCPSVAPANPVTADLEPSGLVHLFDPAAEGDLGRAVAEAIARRDRRGPAGEGFAERYDHRVIAARFAGEIAARLQSPPPGPERA